MIKIEPESTEHLSLHSDGEVLTTVDNSSTESAKKSKFIFIFLVIKHLFRSLENYL